MLYQDKWIIFSTLTIAIALFGCSGDSHKHHSDPLSLMLYSPNGEPLNGGTLGRPTCQEALSKWFDRVDTTHAGTISSNEFLTDTRLQFQRMDIDHNGYLVSEEIERFRQPYRQQTAAEQPVQKPKNDASQGKRSHGGRNGGNHEEEDAGDNTADPVMSADANLDFKVTLDEFMAYAQKQFFALDSNHIGTITKEEVLARCPAK